MTAAGTSATDTLHSLYDQATSVLGLGGAEQNPDKKNESQDAAKKQDENDGPESKQGYISGPGNHPSSGNVPAGKKGDHDHQEYKDEPEYAEDTDTHIDEAGASVGQNKASDGRGDRDKDGKRGIRKTTSGIEADALERALGDEGPVGEQMGTKLGKELEASAMGKQVAETSKKTSEGVNVSTSSAVAGAALGEPLQSERNNPKLQKAKGKKSGKGSDDEKGELDSADEDEYKRKASEAAAQNKSNPRGPRWASRPDDAQREKLKRDAEERKRKDREAKEAAGGKSGSVRSWAKMKVGSGKKMTQGDGGDGGEAEAADDGPPEIKGIDLLRDPKDNEPEARAQRAEAAPSLPQEDRDRPKTSSRLSSMFSRQSEDNQRLSQKDRPSSTAQAEGDDKDKEQGDQDGRPASSSRRNSKQPSNDKMTRISKLMMGGQSRQHSTAPGGSSSPPQSEGGDGSQVYRGLDGVETQEGRPSTASARWSALRKRIKENAAKRSSKGSDQKSRVVEHMSVVTELQSGILPVFMLKMSLERDEQGKRRIPVLLNHLRLRISDSVNVLNNTSAIFRIELEYGDGMIKWVCYRSLRDFINLHTHYRAAAIKGYLGRPVGANEGDVGLPSFPKTSLPYFNQLKQQGWAKNSPNVKAEFAKAQRKALEDYIIEVIKRTMFRPEANRLCKFFEISALSISLAARGGFQGKQGYLRILSKSSRKDAQSGILTPVAWIKSREPKWFIVRETYIVIVDEPDSLQVHDLFLIDGAFEIERPKRLYKQTIHLAHELSSNREKGKEEKASSKEAKLDAEAEKGEEKGEKDSKKQVENKADGEQKKHISEAVDGKDDTAILTEGQFRSQEEEDEAGIKKKGKDDPNANVSSHTFYIKNAERKLKLVARNERQMDQFIASMERVAKRNIFSKSNRFGSFAPIRLNCNAQWLVDGRDYFWQVSRALMRAKDRIFIHDWWLSPELYLRRPGTPKYRLDNILKRKAEEGVKIFVIVYNEVSNNFTPTDSNYTKQRLIGLHRNIYVQRSPSHFQTGTFYWAHHEKLCVIDETIAFMGGLDLCFGRWDTPAHLLTDNHENDIADGDDHPKHDEHLLGPGIDGKEFYVWPGQDFANERVVEWYDLTKPEQDLFDREKHPRMPWHDISLQLIGQPARDLCRHFAQRWNYLLRIKNHKRLMPFLVPPPEFKPSELRKFDLTGTCEAQICRSAGPWSLGTSSTVEHSIQNAYLKAIQMSEHFVYIENQFFVTSTETRGTVIENQIGEALVSRIIRAHREQTPWKAVIVIPLIPGFPMPVDHQDASSVRLILELQNRSICRGEHSIFGKLRRSGIDPDDYIVFCSLRQWGKLASGQLVTEQVYIHAKAMIVDDRLALIGSANINERSQRGDRDSELACVLRDTDLIDSTMAGKPFKVGRFAHTLRVRLMKEHLGLDVDEIDNEAAKLQDVRPKDMLDEDDFWDPANEQSKRDTDADAGRTKVHERGQMGQFSNTVTQAVVPMSQGAKDQAKEEIAKRNPFQGMANGTAGKGFNGDQDPFKQESSESYAEALPDRFEKIVQLGHNAGKFDDGHMIPTIEERMIANETLPPKGPNGTKANGDANQGEASAEELKKSLSSKMSINPWAPPAISPNVDPDLFEDPLDERFFKGMWMASAIHNTQIYRKVFKSVPDDTVTTWAEYKAFNAWAERLARSGLNKSKGEDGAIATSHDQSSKHNHNRNHSNTVDSRHSMGGSPKANGNAPISNGKVESDEKTDENGTSPEAQAGEGAESGGAAGSANKHPTGASATIPKSIPRPPNMDDGFSAKELQQMEKLLESTVGTLVLHCTRFLEAEDRSDNLLFPMDKINPLNVYD